MQDTRHTRTECVLLRRAPGAADATRAEQNRWFTDSDRTTIESYFDGEWLGATAAQGQARLPQVRSRWIVGARLPAHARTSALPGQLEERLTPLEPGYRRLMVSSEILYIEVESLRIVDVMRNAAARSATVGTAHLLLDGAATQAVAG